MRLVTILTSIAFLLVISLQLIGLVLQARTTVLVPALVAGSPVWLPAAAVCWVVILAGLIAETIRPHRPLFPPRGWFARRGEGLLDVLTGQPRRARSLAAIDPEALATALRQRVVGQDIACEEIAQQLHLRVGLAARGRPLGVFLLAGPPGSGKTLLGRCLAEICRRPLLHFDMTQFAELHAASQMFGVPPGYAGSERKGRLVAGLADNPNAVVLLDEVEKGHPEMLRKFLVAWNDGVVTDSGSGRQVSCVDAIFVLTTNAASDALAALARDGSADGRTLRFDALGILRRAGFASEVLDRIDRVLIFSPLDRASMLLVATAEATSLVQSCQLLLGSPIDAQIFAPLLGRPSSEAIRSARDVKRLLEEAIGAQLVAARAAGTRRVDLIGQPDGIAVVGV